MRYSLLLEVYLLFQKPHYSGYFASCLLYAFYIFKHPSYPKDSTFYSAIPSIGMLTFFPDLHYLCFLSLSSFLPYSSCLVSHLPVPELQFDQPHILSFLSQFLSPSITISLFLSKASAISFSVYMLNSSYYIQQTFPTPLLILFLFLPPQI